MLFRSGEAVGDKSERHGRIAGGGQRGRRRHGLGQGNGRGSHGWRRQNLLLPEPNRRAAQGEVQAKRNRKCQATFHRASGLCLSKWFRLRARLGRLICAHGSRQGLGRSLPVFSRFRMKRCNSAGAAASTSKSSPSSPGISGMIIGWVEFGSRAITFFSQSQSSKVSSGVGPRRMTPARLTFGATPNQRPRDGSVGGLPALAQNVLTAARGGLAAGHSDERHQQENQQNDF